MRKLSSALCAASLSCAGAAAFAGNEEGVLFGSAAEMSAGAVTATTQDGCALWYNPAGLAGADTQQLDVSGTAYVFRQYSAPDLIRVPGGPSVPGEVTELMSVSASLTYVRRLSERLSLGFGLFTPRSSDEVFRVNAQVPGDVRWLLTVTQTAAEYDAGIGLGWAPSPRLRFGASLFVAYESVFGASQAQVALGPGPIQDQYASSASLYAYKRVGLELALGAQWRPVDALRVGITVRPPGASVYASEARDTSESAAERDASGALRAEARGTSTRDSAFEFAQRTPLRVRLGVALERPRFTVSLDADFATELSPDDPDDKRWSGHWNLRAGGVLRVSDRLRVGAGFFTDRDPARGPGGRPVDFYGGTAGVEWGTLHLLRAAQRDRLTFSTSLSARYAYGSGTIPAVQAVAGAVASTPAESAIEVHEVAVYLGSSFRF